MCPPKAPETHSVPFVRTTDGLWTAKLVRDAKEFWVYLIMQVRDDATGEVDDNRGAYWDLVFCIPNGMPSSLSVKWQADEL